MLAEVPFEILGQIAEHLSQAQHFHNLSLTCRRLHRFVEEDGWRIFVQECFPSIQTPPFWKGSSHGLTTISRNWDRRALIARYLQPSGSIFKLPGGVRQTHWSRPKGQTMGFQPAIDSYECWTGPSWSSKTEVLAFSTGAELALRVKHSGPEVARRWEDIPEDTRRLTYDQYRNFVQWITYKPDGAREGIDDITCIKLQREVAVPFSTDSFSLSIFIGTASGRLENLQIPLEASIDTPTCTRRLFDTQSRAVNAVDVSIGAQQLLAACLSGTSVALYPIGAHQDETNTQSEVLPACEVTTSKSEGSGPKQRTWTTKFISSAWLAVGTGPSEAPLSIYQVAPSGIAETPIRRFSCRPHHRSDSSLEYHLRPPVTSAYQVAPLSSLGANGDLRDDVFLCGYHDGFIAAHDMRSPSDFVQTYNDPIDQSAIYSLQNFGRERIAAGGARHSTLKFFDLRLTGGRAYYHKQTIPAPAKRPSQYHCYSQERCKQRSPPGWNLFLTPRDPMIMSRRPRRGMHINQRRGQFASTAQDSPIYSLSSPSPCSTSLFAGIENHIVQIDLVSMLDKHPDPVFQHGIVRRPGVGDIHVGKTWDPAGDVLNLAMYDHNEGGGVGLMTQAGAAGSLRSENWVEGYDQRWRRTESWKK